MSTISKRWRLEDLFSFEGYATYGKGVIPVWALILILLRVLAEYWERLVTGVPIRNPNLLPGLHPDAAVYSIRWLADFRAMWSAEIFDDQS